MSTSLNISLSETMKAWVETQVEAGGYRTTSDYFRQLVQAEQQRQVRQQVDDNLHAALDSGDATPMTKKDWDRIRREGRKRIAAKKRKPS